MNIDKLDEIFDGFHNSKILVVGDVMIDCYIMGTVNRVSPEAPVPIVQANSRSYRLGGAANVALNLKSLGVNPILCSVIGDDTESRIFDGLMEDAGLEAVGIMPMAGRKTTIKYRVIGNNAHIVRVDDERDEPLTTEQESLFVDSLKKLIVQRGIEAMILEDYDKGLFSKSMIAELVQFARQQGVLVTVDPKKRNFGNYEHVDLFKPNLKELAAGLKMEEGVELSLDDIHALAKQFAVEKDIERVMVTLSSRGVAMYDKRNDRFLHQTAFQRRVSDVSGAGDTVISVATLFLLAGEDAASVCLASNLAGGLVCEYVGVVPVSNTQLKNEIVKNHTATVEY